MQDKIFALAPLMHVSSHSSFSIALTYSVALWKPPRTGLAVAIAVVHEVVNVVLAGEHRLRPVNDVQYAALIF